MILALWIGVLVAVFGVFVLSFRVNELERELDELRRRVCGPVRARRRRPWS